MTRGRLVAVGVLGATIFLAVAGWRWREGLHSFDARHWKADRGVACSEGYDGAREWMVNDLRQNELRVGMSPDQVSALLGRPEKVYDGAGRTKTWVWATAPTLTRCSYLTATFVNGRLAETDHYS